MFGFCLMALLHITPSAAAQVKKQTNKQLYLRRVTHNSNSTDELVALDPKSTIIRIKMFSRIIKLVDRSIRI